MNDPMEGLHRESALFKRNKNYESMTSKVKEQIDSIGIASLTEIHNLEPMWAYYADGFSGMCVAYSMRKLLSGLPSDHELVRMNYSEDPPILLNNRDSADFRAKLALSSKTLRWSHEREWRLIRPTSGKAEYKDKDTVTAVYLGARVKQDYRKLIIDAMGELSIRVYEMEIEKYFISFKPLKTQRKIARVTRKT